MSYLVVFSRCLFGVVFLVSAVSKLRGGRQFQEFADSLTAMRVLPARSTRRVAAAVAVAELAVPVLLAPLPVPALAVPALAVTGLALAAVLLAGFAVAIIAVLRRGITASCRCFGGARPAAFGWHHVARNAVLTVFAGAGGYASLQHPAVDWPALLFAGAVALVGALIAIRLDDLVHLFTPISAAR